MNLAGAKGLFLRRLARKLRQIADRLEMEALVFGRTVLGDSALETSASTPPLTRSGLKSESSLTNPVPAGVLMSMKSRLS